MHICICICKSLSEPYVCVRYNQPGPHRYPEGEGCIVWHHDEVRAHGPARLVCLPAASLLCVCVCQFRVRVSLYLCVVCVSDQSLCWPVWMSHNCICAVFAYYRLTLIHWPSSDGSLCVCVCVCGVSV